MGASKLVENDDVQDDGENVDALRSDVARELRALGLAAGNAYGANEEFDFSDFAPSASARPINPTSTSKSLAKKNKRHQRLDNDLDNDDDGGDDDDDNQSKKGGAPSAEAPNVRTRVWNEGAGKAPASLATLQPPAFSDEPSIWHEALDALTSADRGANAKPPKPADVARMKATARDLCQAASDAFEKGITTTQGNTQEAKWLRQVRKTGTASDRLAASVLVVRESCLANLKALDALVETCCGDGGGGGGGDSHDKSAKQARRQHRMAAIRALSELFQSDVLLPSARRMRTFEARAASLVQPDVTTKDGARTLMYWYVEDEVKRCYSRFVDALEAASKDMLAQMKGIGIKALAGLLTAKPENEQRMLSLVVNKLGDPDRHAASQASFLLTGVVAVHPAMKRIICDEVASMCFRRNVGFRALYYCLLFLHGISYSHRKADTQLASRMMATYFELLGRLFGNAAAKQEDGGDNDDANEPSSRSSKKKDKKTPKKKGRMGKAAAKAAKKAAKANAAGAGDADPLAVDSRLLGALLTGIRRAFPYVDADRSDELIESHLPRLFKLAHVSSLKASVQIAAVVHQLLDARRSTSDRFHRLVYELLSRAGDTASHAGGEHRGVVNRLLTIVLALCRDDVSHTRVCAYARRMLQVAGRVKPPTACGMLLVVSEMCASKPKLRDLMIGTAKDARDEDLVETFADDDADDDGLVALDAPGNARVRGGDGSSADPSRDVPSAFDPRARDPRFSGADLEAVWELGLLVSHVHPSVRAMATQLASTGRISYNGDPTADLTLMSFLHKFAKKKAKDKGAAEVEVGSRAFGTLPESEISADDLFHFRYWRSKEQGQEEPPAKRRRLREDDFEEEDDDDDDVFADADTYYRTGGAQRQRAADDDDDDDDIDIDIDFDDDDDDDDDDDVDVDDIDEDDDDDDDDDDIDEDDIDDELFDELFENSDDDME